MEGASQITLGEAKASLNTSPTAGGCHGSRRGGGQKQRGEPGSPITPPRTAPAAQDAEDLPATAEHPASAGILC